MCIRDRSILKHDKNYNDSSETLMDLETKRVSHKTEDKAASLLSEQPNDFASLNSGNNDLNLDMNKSTSEEKVLPLENVPDNNESGDKCTDSDDDDDDYPDHFSLSDLSEDEEDVRKTKTNNITDNEYDSQTEKLLTHLRSALGFPQFSKTECGDSKFQTDCRSAILSGTNLFKVLKDWFPHMQNDYLEGISNSQAVNKNDDVALADLYCRIFNADSTILNRGTDGTETTQFPFIRFRLFPPQQAISNMFDLELDNLYRLASGEYKERYETNASNKINDFTTKYAAPPLEYIDYIYNEELVSQFEQTKQNYLQQKIPELEKRLFHGTHQDCIKPIISGNFDVNAAPVGRGKAMAYGKGIYFSDYPSFSFQYGKSLLMCRVLPGLVTFERHNTKLACYNSFQLSSNRIPHTQSPSFDQNKGKSLSQIYVVKEPRQVLPCYILYMREDTEHGNL